MTTTTPNKGYTYPGHGASVDAWDTPLNTNFDYIDLNLGGPYPLTITSTGSAITYNSTYASIGSAATTITPPSTLAENIYYKYSGTMTADQTIIFPAAGGLYVINNASDGAYTLTAAVSGSTSVSVDIAQGGTNVVVTDGTDMVLANSNVLASMKTYSGDPNGNVAGTAGATDGSGTDFEWDSTNKNLFAATTSGTTATTVWTPIAAKLAPQGILSATSSTTSPIITSNTTTSTIYYTPYIGNWMLVSDGNTVYPYQFSQMSLVLTSAQAASTLYDVFFYWNSGAPVIGTGPAWSVSTAGSCSRGTGTGTTQLARLQGILVNAVSATLTNNGVAYACPANEGTYLGSIFVDTSAGNVTCHVRGIWNNYNRRKIRLLIGDTTSSWTYNSTLRASNGDSNNSGYAFQGIAEGYIDVNFLQILKRSNDTPYIGVGWNSTSATSGWSGFSAGEGYSANGIPRQAFYNAAPAIGINLAYCLESCGGGGTNTWFGGNDNMQMLIEYMA